MSPTGDKSPVRSVDRATPAETGAESMRAAASTVRPIQHRLPDVVRTQLEAICGPITGSHVVGRSGATWIVTGIAGRCVVKRLPAPLDGVSLSAVLAAVARAGVRVPELLSICTGHASGESERIDSRWAIFDFVAGTIVAPNTSAADLLWQQARAILRQLHDVNLRVIGAPLPRLDALWLTRTRMVTCSDAVAQLRGELDARQSELSTDAFAHGDFAPQNMLTTDAGLVLIDWEAFGVAPRGFDAGWVCALNAIGAGPQWSPTAMRSWVLSLNIDPVLIRYATGVGLLRLHWRASIWADGQAGLQLLVDRIAAAIALHVRRE
jgi:aminoglycoside phosphotransferase (APT) family kinase protein